MDIDKVALSALANWLARKPVKCGVLVGLKVILIKKLLC
jgi:hypothetical protein